MTVTLLWKEYREHRAIWLTMVVMTCALGWGLLQFVSPQSSANSRLETAAVAVLGMAVVYGVVCGAMMFAGEREAGTLTFLDIFLGRRGLLWSGKFLIGVILVLLQGLTVALVLRLLKQTPPAWLPIIIGHEIDRGLLVAGPTPASPDLWLRVLPLVTLEAYAWGLLGSSFSQRVLVGATLAASMTAPLWLVTLFAPPQLALVLRLLAAGTALFLSGTIFLTQARETPLGPAPRSSDPHPLQVQLVGWQGGAKFELERRAPQLARSGRPAPDPVPIREAPPEPRRLVRHADRLAQPSSPVQVLWWLTLRQGLFLLAVLAGAALLGGLLVPAFGQVLWPVGTLLLGVACGTAPFAQEQSDLSYQFLAAQHLPLKKFWNVKVLFWLAAGVLAALLALGGGGLVVLAQALNQPGQGLAGSNPGFRLGTLRQRLGPVLFFGVWFVYGFCLAQVFVLFCRKTVLAVLLAGLVSFAGLSLWLSALVCGGMSGWQVFLPPLAMLAASRLLMRAWAGGRIKDRRPLSLVIGLGLAALAWLAVNLVSRAWEIPEVEEPLDREAFHATILSGRENEAGHRISRALAEMNRPEAREDDWLAPMAAAARLPVGWLETPSREGRAPTLLHLPDCQTLAGRLQALARTAIARQEPGPAFTYLAQTLALSRNLRNKAVRASYLVGVEIEASALEDLDLWMAQKKPARELLRRVQEELDRHVAQTPSPLDCLQTECYRAGGLLERPPGWTFYAEFPNPDRVREGWLAGAIALSLEMPWEKERTIRLWRTVWAGLFRGLKAPPGALAEFVAGPRREKFATQLIMQGWLPATEGPDANLTRAEMTRLLDASWLADFRLFTLVLPLRQAATRSRCGVDACRLQVALGRYQLQEGKPAARLRDLVPQYLPELPADPYTGQAFHYRISRGELLTLGDQQTVVQPGQGILWSTGPDRVDNGGHKRGNDVADEDLRWSDGELDLITIVPHWR